MIDQLMDATMCGMRSAMNDTQPRYTQAQLTNAATLSAYRASYGTKDVPIHKLIARPTGRTLLQGRAYTSAAATDVASTWRKFQPAKA